MSQFRTRLQSLARRLVEQAGSIQYLIRWLSSQPQVNSSTSAWLDPVTVPSSGQARQILRSSEGFEAVGALRDFEPNGTHRTPVLLATHFLEDWYEWQALSYRFSYFHGRETENTLSGPDVKLAKGASEQVDALAASEGFLEAFRTSMSPGAEQKLAGDLIEDLRRVGADETAEKAESPDPREVVSSVARFGEYDRLVRGLAERTRQHDQEINWLYTFVKRLDRVGISLIDLVVDLKQKSDAAAAQLRAYRYSSLNLSWLISRNEKVIADLFEGGNLPFTSLLYRRIDEIEGRQRATARGRAEERPINKILRRVFRTVEEIGLGRFARAVEHNGFHRGGATLFAGQSAHVITSRKKTVSDNPADADVCIGLAISDGFYPGPPPDRDTRETKRRSKRLEQKLSDQDEVLEQVKQWIAENGPDGKTVLIVTDLWAPEEFADRQAEIFGAWGKRGAEVFVTAPNHDGTGLSVVDSDFG